MSTAKTSILLEKDIFGFILKKAVEKLKNFRNRM